MAVFGIRPLTAAPLRALSALFLVTVGTGCTAVPALVQCRKAESSLSALESRVAETTAASGTSEHDAVPSAALDASASYELTLARAYLDKAREEASEAHYGLSIQLAKNSQRASKRAVSALAAARTRAGADNTTGQRGRL